MLLGLPYEGHSKQHNTDIQVR